MSFILALDQGTTSSRAVAMEAIARAGVTAADIAAIGITNQRETTVVWDRATGKPIHHAIVWQDRRSSAEVETLAASVPDNGGVYLAPAFTGLGAPHWDPYARGALLGITRGTTAGHIARATLESIAFQTADLLGIPVVRPRVRETTALGAAYLAGLAVGYWRDRAEIGQLWQAEHTFTPAMERGKAADLRRCWSRALERSKGWAEP